MLISRTLLRPYKPTKSHCAKCGLGFKTAVYIALLFNQQPPTCKDGEMSHEWK